jgi:glucose/arabinose dehydrogenase
MAHIWVLVLLALISCACRGIGWPSRLDDQPAPTTIPLNETAQPAVLPGTNPPQEPIVLPAGFAINVYAQGLNEPRMLTIGPDGNLYVAEHGAGPLCACRPESRWHFGWD